MGDVLLAARPTAPLVHPESRAFQLAEARGGRVHVLSVVGSPHEAARAQAREIADDLAARRGRGRWGMWWCAREKPGS